MRHFTRALLAALVLLAAGLVSEAFCWQAVHHHRAMDPQRFNAAYGYPRAAIDPPPGPGALPYWGQALGGTYYNWGYFGARDHAQYRTHRSYYGEYNDIGYMKGY